MLRSLLVVLMIFVIAGCTTQMSEDQKFENLAANYTNGMLKMSPEWATYLGDHQYDHLMNDYSLAAIEKELKFNQLYLDSLNQIQKTQLSVEHAIDYSILKENIEYGIFMATEIKSFEWNPLVYNPGGAIYNLLARDFAPLPERLKNVKNRLMGIPAVLEAAQTNLQNPPKVFTETAIMQNKGVISLVENDLQQFIDEAPGMEEELADARAVAVQKLTEYGEWLEKELLPRSDGEFRIGAEKFDKKLKFALSSDLSRAEILQRAEDDLVITQDALYQTAAPLYQKYFGKKAPADKKTVIKNVLDKLAENAPTNENIVELAEKTLQTTTDFVRDNNIVTVPEEPVEIIVMPEFQRGYAVAYCDPPGALDKAAKTFYAISPTPADWDKQRVKSFFREYNIYMLENLTIHEAMPGHYLQLAHANKAKAPTLVRNIWYSGTFVEGWATYAEQVMVEKGYGGPELKMQQLKMRLRLIINAIIDQKIHTAGMTEEEAVALMMNEGFQEEGEAAGKWRRACLSSTQLSTYFVGNIELNDLRSGYEAKNGDQFDMKMYHDKLLSYGSIPAKHLKSLLEL